MGDWADQYDEGDMVLPTKSPDQPSAGNKELPFQFKNNYPDDEEWTAVIELLNEWTPADTQLRHIVQFIRSAEFRPAHFYVELLEQYITASNQQLLRELEAVASKYQNATEIVENGKRYLIVGKKKLPYGFPYPDSKSKYAIEKVLSIIQDKLKGCGEEV